MKLYGHSVWSAKGAEGAVKKRFASVILIEPQRVASSPQISARNPPIAPKMSFILDGVKYLFALCVLSTGVIKVTAALSTLGNDAEPSLEPLEFLGKGLANYIIPLLDISST